MRLPGERGRIHALDDPLEDVLAIGFGEADCLKAIGLGKPICLFFIVANALSDTDGLASAQQQRK